MTNPAKNRLHDYEAGWLTLLLKMGVASKKALQEAQNRVARAAINETQMKETPFKTFSIGVDRIASLGILCFNIPLLPLGLMRGEQLG
jgi:hypothetical protein